MILNVSMACGATDEELSRLNGKIFEITRDVITPIDFARVAIYENEELIVEERTRSDGSYSFLLKPGMYSIRVEKTRYILQEAFVILDSNSTIEIDFNLELKSVLTPSIVAVIIVEGIPEGLYPEMQVDGRFYGYALNDTKMTFKAYTSHTIELSGLSEDNIKYVLRKPVFSVSEEKNIALKAAKGRSCASCEKLLTQEVAHQLVVIWE